MEKLSIDDGTYLAEGTVVVKFAATWCGPCRLYAPAFARVESKNPEARFYEVDIDEEPELKETWSVVTVPTTVIFKEGREVARISGAQSTGKLDDLVKGVLD